MSGLETAVHRTDNVTAANKMFLQWCGEMLSKVYIFAQRFVSGTGRGFGSAPLQKHKRYKQCRWTEEK